MFSCVAVVAFGAAGAQAVTFNVDKNDAGCNDGTGTPYCTIQAAVDAAAALDIPTGPGGGPPADPVDIVIKAGTYVESVSIPDENPVAVAGDNDFWTIRSAAGEKVTVKGGITVGVDRDNFTFDGINVELDGQHGYFFGDTARSNTVKNACIYGGGTLFGSQATGFAGITQDRLFGTNTYDHITLVGCTSGHVSTDHSTSVWSNSIIAYCDEVGSSQAGGNLLSYDHSNLFNPAPATNCSSLDLGGLGDCTEAYDDQGNNINHPTGSNPLFASLDPSNSEFLKLTPGSPCAGMGSSAGAFTSGQLNMGAKPTGTVQMGACCRPTGVCEQASHSECGFSDPGVFFGDGTDCVNFTCDKTLFVVDQNDAGCSAAGDPFCKIQDAVIAAIGLDDPTSLADQPRPDPVQIRIHGGVYNETVIIPPDPAGGAKLLTANDGWHIFAAEGEDVRVIGGFNIYPDRDTLTFDGIDVTPSGAPGFNFQRTARNCTVKNACIWGGGTLFGGSGHPGIRCQQLSGGNLFDHLTIVGNSTGTFYTGTSGAVVTNTIIAFNDDVGVDHDGTIATASASFSNVFNDDNCRTAGVLDDCNDNLHDVGNNVNWPFGLDPLFASLVPGNPEFLFLSANSPSAGTGQLGSNMGAKPSSAAVATVGGCCTCDDTECFVTSSSGCATLIENVQSVTGAYQGDGTVCDPLPVCPACPGACCLPNGTCSQIDDDVCTAQDGIFLGFGSTCGGAGQVCSLTGACCQANESCTEVPKAQCVNVDQGIYNGDTTRCFDVVCARTLLVGPGKEFRTILAAVNAAASLDDPSAQSGVPPPKPIMIIVFEGIYDEGRVIIPPDESTAFDGANDGWTIRAATTADTGKAFNDTVVLHGLFAVQQDRDHMTFDGIHVMEPVPGVCDAGICDIGGTDTCIGGPRDGEPCQEQLNTPFGPNAECGLCIGGPKAFCPDGRAGNFCTSTPGDERICETDIECTGQDWAYQFVQTARDCTIKNCLVFGITDSTDTGGDFHGNAFYANRLFGTNTIEHVTLFNNLNHIQARSASCTWNVRDTIAAFAFEDGLRTYCPEAAAGCRVSIDHSLVYDPPNLPQGDPVLFEDTVNCYSRYKYGDCLDEFDEVILGVDLGGNVNIPLDTSECDVGGTNTCVGGPKAGQACTTDLECVGEAPQFISTDPMDENFLRLAPTSPAVGTATSVGTYTDGEMNMGVFGSGPVVPGSTDGACCLPDATCAEMSIFACAHSGGSWQGRGVTCGEVNCAIGACCAITGICTEIIEADCPTDWRGPASTCAVANCPFIQTDPVFDRPEPGFPIGDSDVDDMDFAKFQLCITGSFQGHPPVSVGCEDFDRPELGFPNGDGDIDENDFENFLACANTSGPTIPADTDCDDLQACCLTGPTCQDLVPGICEDPSGANGTAQGPGTDCATVGTSCP